MRADASWRRFAPMVAVIAMLGAFIAVVLRDPLWWTPRYVHLLVIAGVATLDAVVMTAWPRLDRTRLTMFGGAMLLVTLGTLPTASRHSVASIVLASVLATALFGALCAGAALASLGDPPRAPSASRGRVAIALVAPTALGLLALGVRAFDTNGAASAEELFELLVWPGHGAAVPLVLSTVVAATGLSWYASRPAAQDQASARSGALVLAIAAVFATGLALDAFVMVDDLYRARNYGCDAPPRWIHLHEADYAYRSVRALAACLLFALAPAAWLATEHARRGGWKTLAPAALPLAVLIATPVLLRDFLDSPADNLAHVGCAFDAVAPVDIEPARVERTLGWSAIRCDDRDERVVIGLTFARTERGGDLQALLADRRSRDRLWQAPILEVIADRRVTLARILAVIDPSERERWVVQLGFLGTPPLAWMSPLALAHPQASMQIAFTHRADERYPGLPPRRVVTIPDEETVEAIAARALTPSSTWYRTAHPSTPPPARD